MNKVILTGRLTHAPELKVTAGGIAITKIGIAVSSPHVSGQCDFFDVVAWRSTAEFICKYFTKGKWIELECHLENANFKKDGKTVYRNDIVCDEASFGGNKSGSDINVLEAVADDDELPFK